MFLSGKQQLLLVTILFGLLVSGHAEKEKKEHIKPRVSINRQSTIFGEPEGTQGTSSNVIAGGGSIPTSPVDDPTPSPIPGVVPDYSPGIRLPVARESSYLTSNPTNRPTKRPTQKPTPNPTTPNPTTQPPTGSPTNRPTRQPTNRPTNHPTFPRPTASPTFNPTSTPTFKPTGSPSFLPTPRPTMYWEVGRPGRDFFNTKDTDALPASTIAPTGLPTKKPWGWQWAPTSTIAPTGQPTRKPSSVETGVPSATLEETTDEITNEIDYGIVDGTEDETNDLDGNYTESEDWEMFPETDLAADESPTFSPTTWLPTTTYHPTKVSITDEEEGRFFRAGGSSFFNLNQEDPAAPQQNETDTQDSSIIRPGLSTFDEPTPSPIRSNHGAIPGPTYSGVGEPLRQQPTSPPTFPIPVVPDYSPGIRVPVARESSYLTSNPTSRPTKRPTQKPTPVPTTPNPTTQPSKNPTVPPTYHPTGQPTINPTNYPTLPNPTASPTFNPTGMPTTKPTPSPSTARPTRYYEVGRPGRDFYQNTVAPTPPVSEDEEGRADILRPGTGFNTDRPTSPSFLQSNTDGQPGYRPISTGVPLRPLTPEPTPSPVRPAMAPVPGVTTGVVRDQSYLTSNPTGRPTKRPTQKPTPVPTTPNPTTQPPTGSPTNRPTRQPTNRPTNHPTFPRPTASPTFNPTGIPTSKPTGSPSFLPTPRPTRYWEVGRPGRDFYQNTVAPIPPEESQASSPTEVPSSIPTDLLLGGNMTEYPTTSWQPTDSFEPI